MFVGKRKFSDHVDDIKQKFQFFYPIPLHVLLFIFCDFFRLYRIIIEPSNFFLFILLCVFLFIVVQRLRRRRRRQRQRQHNNNNNNNNNNNKYHCHYYYSCVHTVVAGLIECLLQIHH